MEPNTPWKYDIEICTQKNVHGLVFDQVSTIAEHFVARRIKIASRAIKRAMKATIEQQAPDQAAGSGEVISFLTTIFVYNLIYCLRSLRTKKFGGKSRRKFVFLFILFRSKDTEIRVIELNQGSEYNHLF